MTLMISLFVMANLLAMSSMAENPSTKQLMLPLLMDKMATELKISMLTK